MGEFASIIPDKNLRLALLDEIQEDSDWVSAHEDDYEAAREAYPDWPDWREPEENEGELNGSLEAYLLSLEVSPAELAAIARLTLDGDREIYEWLGGENWYEEEDLFTIHDLAGIEQCRALEYLLLGQGMVQGASLRVLAGLPELRELHACALSGFTDVEAVLEIPALETLSVVNIETSADRDQWQRVVDAFESKR